MTLKKEIVGVLTNFGQIIPIKRGLQNDTNLPVVDINFYPNADKYLSKEIFLINDEEKWSNERKKERDDLFIIKKELGKFISQNENIKNNIIDIVKDKEINKFKKIDLINNIFKNILEKNKQVFTDVQLSDISNEVINDNIENLLINNVIMEQIYNQNEIKKTDTESIWLNINDITNWFKKYESENE